MLLSLIFIVSGAWAQSFTSEGMSLVATPVVSGEDVIWGFAFPAVDEILFTTRSGKLKTYNLKTKIKTEISGVPKVITGEQAGLMDVSLHPNFDKNHLVYLTYNCGKDDAVAVCMGRGTLQDNKLKFENLFESQPRIDSKKNLGSRLAWDKNGFLYMTVGDFFETRDLAQKLDTHVGKVLRFDEDGKAADNSLAKTKKALPEIYSYGHRNSEGLFYDGVTGTLWEQEHGPQGGDEINIIKAGANYGWPIITYGIDYNGKKIGEGTKRAGMEQPFHYWDPSIAPSGLTIYHGIKLSGWDGDLFSGALKLTRLNRLKIKNGRVVKEERLLTDLGKRIRDVRVGPDGWLYFSTDSGDIYRIETK